MRATLLDEQVCRVQSTKHEENVQRCSRYSSLPVHTLLSRKVFSRLCRICGGDRLELMARFQLFFFPTLLYRLPFGLSVSSTVEVHFAFV